MKPYKSVFDAEQLSIINNEHVKIRWRKCSKILQKFLGNKTLMPRVQATPNDISK